MNNLKILLKNNLNCFFGTFQGKRNRKKLSLTIVFCLLGYIGICALFGLQIFGLFKAMSVINLGEIPLFNSMQIVVMILLMMAFQQLTGKAKTQDSDFLMALPIRKIDIVISKTVSKYLFNLMLTSMIMIPTIVLYCIYFGLSASVILWGLFLMILLPLLSVGLNYILNFLIVKLFNRNKFAYIMKTIFAIIIYTVFISIYIYNSSIMGTIETTTIDDFLNQNFFIGWCVRIMCDSNIINLLYVLLIVIGVFVIGLVMYASIFGKNFVGYQAKKDKTKYSKTGRFNGLFAKELNRYFTTPIYMFNTLIGPLMIIILTVFLMIKGKDGIASIFMMNIGSETIFAILILVYLFMSAMTLVSCCSISLEGKYLWILRSTPVNTKKLLIAKSLVNMFVFIPVQLITSVLICIVFEAGIQEWLLFLLIPLLSNVILSFVGTYINILMPKLNWENEAQAVKQGLSVLVTMLIGFVLTAIPVIMNLLKINLYACGYITLGIYIIFAIISLVLLLTHGIKKFNKLGC